MKIIKFLSTIFLISLLSNCVFTKDILWSDKYYKESFDGYFVDRKTNSVVLIGENKVVYKGHENYHYLISDVANIGNIFEIGVRSKDLSISFGYTQGKGSQIISRLGIGFDKKNLSKNEINFLQINKFSDGETGSRIGYIYRDLKIIRYPSSQEKIKGYSITSLSNHNNIDIWEKNTPLQTTGKILLTPFTLIADTILIPYYAYAIAKESKVDHFCEGDFCGYDKILNKTNPKK